MGLPKPDLVIYLDVDIETSLARMARRQAATDTKADIHERDVDYLKRCLHTANTAADFFGWTRVSVTENGEMLPEAAIGETLWRMIGL